MDTYSNSKSTSKYRKDTGIYIDTGFSENNTVEQRSADVSNFRVKKGTETSRLEARKRSMAKKADNQNLKDQQYKH